MADKTDVTVVRYHEDLPVAYTGEQLTAMAFELARITAQVAAIKEEKKVVNAEFNARLKECGKQIADLARKINERADRRPVEVSCSIDWKEGTKSITRLDTGDVISEGVPISQEERQQQLEGWEQEVTSGLPDQERVADDTETPGALQPGDDPPHGVPQCVARLAQARVEGRTSGCWELGTLVCRNTVGCCLKCPPTTARLCHNVCAVVRSTFPARSAPPSEEQRPKTYRLNKPVQGKRKLSDLLRQGGTQA